MEINSDTINRRCPERDIYNQLLQLDDKHILELGCGSAEHTRAIAGEGKNRTILALEVDEHQHAKNLQLNDLPNVSFRLGGAEKIPVEDNSQDIILMFKSLHHVPEKLMNQAMNEIHRVLVPGGLAYISEPVFAGDFNEVIRLFHDESKVRTAAFKSLENAIRENSFSLRDEIFFNTDVEFKNFREFEKKVIKVTHTEHNLSDDTYREVKTVFENQFRMNNGQFTAPIRVDLLQVKKKSQKNLKLS